MRNSIEFEAAGELALFTDPIIGTGGGCCSLPVPTYEALKGLCRAVYFDPSFEWVVDAVRVMNPVRTEALSASFGVSGGLGVYCCLSDVRYQIRAHFVCAGNGFHAPKIYSICKRSLVKGGRRETYLGKRMCACSIAPTVFGEGVGYYDDVSWNLGLMYHGLDYHDNGSITARLFECRLDNGVIEFPVPKDCTVYHTIKEGRQHALV